MYKLVVVGGKLRGNEYVLNSGESILGRDDSCEINLQVDGISKKHISITTTNDSLYIKDLGSSNGTFLNGKLITTATAKNGDKITLPDTIIEIVYVKEKKIIIKKKVNTVDEKEYITGGTPPNRLLPKLTWFFKYKLMNFIYGINEEYEWRVLFAILLVIFCIIATTLTIIPVLRNNRSILLYEIAKRGSHYAEEIARINSRALEQKKFDRIDTRFLDSEDGVNDYRLFDLEGRIVRPIERLNEYIDDSFSVEAREWALTNKNPDTTLKKILSKGIVGIGKKIMAFNPKLGVPEPVGIIAIKFAPKSLKIESALSSRAYFESLVTIFLVAILFYLSMYYLTVRSVDEMNFQVEEVLKGIRKSLDSSYLLSEMNTLRGNINTVIQRLRELDSEVEDDFDELESDELYVRSLSELMKGSDTPTIILDSQKNLSYINPEAEDICGIRELSSKGANILDITREKGFSATIIELCDKSANEDGANNNGYYELGGNNYNIHVTSLIGKDKFAKAYYITLLKEK